MYSYVTTYGYTFEVILFLIIDLFILYALFQIPQIGDKERWIIYLSLLGTAVPVMDLLLTTPGFTLGTIPFFLVNLFGYLIYRFACLGLLRLTEMKFHESKTLFDIWLVPTLICAAIELTSYWTHLFVYLDEDGVFRHGSWFRLLTGEWLAILLFILAISIIRIVNPKNKEKRQILVQSIEYPLIFLVGAVLSMQMPEEPFYSLGMTMMLVFLFINNHEALYADANRELEVLFRKEQELSRTDVLTGVRNRLAMYEYMEAHGNVAGMAVIYCDVTGLKRINDEQGHEAGDLLLQKATEGMLAIFDKEQVFRIGGDEFIIFAQGIKETSLHSSIQKMQKHWNNSGVNVALGYDFTDHIEPIDQMSLRAETKMYQAKSEWYKNNGVERRRE